jgi:hypothetical protein
LRGSSVTERLRVAGNADWQEKRVLRCWPSVNGGTSGLEYGAGKPPPLHCQVLNARGLVAVPLVPPQRQLRGAASRAQQLPEGHRLALPRPRPQPGRGVQVERGYNKVSAGGFQMGLVLILFSTLELSSPLMTEPEPKLTPPSIRPPRGREAIFQSERLIAPRVWR